MCSTWFKLKMHRVSANNMNHIEHKFELARHILSVNVSFMDRRALGNILVSKDASAHLGTFPLFSSSAQVVQTAMSKQSSDVMLLGPACWWTALSRSTHMPLLSVILCLLEAQNRWKWGWSMKQILFTFWGCACRRRPHRGMWAIGLCSLNLQTSSRRGRCGPWEV